MKLLLLVISTIFISPSFGQTVIRGTVKDVKGEPVPGANIVLEGTYEGTSSDVNGIFSFKTHESGSFNLVVKFIGYKIFVKPVMLEGKEVIMDVKLMEEVNQLEAVTITAGSFTASDASRRTVFRAVDIATTAGATADIAGALNTLPGTQKVGESGRLFVRGGDGSETRTFIDGMVVLDAYGPAAPNTPSRGRFLPFMFKGTSFSTGGYSAEFGQALSSALVLDSKDESETTRTDIGLLSVGGDVAHTHAWDRGSVAGKIQYTNIRPYVGLISQEVDWIKPPASVEGVTAFRQKVGKDGMFKFYGNFNHSNFSLNNHDIDDPSVISAFDLTNKYLYLNSFYRNRLNDKWNVRGGLSYTDIRNEIQLEGVTIDERENGIHAKTVLDGSLSSSVELKAGVEVIQRSYEQAYFPSGTDASRLAFEEWLGSIFAEGDLYFTNKLVMRIGGRVEHNSLASETSLDPRVSFAYKTDKTGQVSFAYGTFRQTARNEFAKINSELESEKAEHFILNYQRIENNRTFRIETFYKRYADLVKFDPFGAITNDGSGYARGAELFWRDSRTVKRLDYWVSYSYIDTERNYLNFPYETTPSFASTHNFSLVTKYFVQSLKSQLGATFSYASGRPFNNPNEDRFNAGRTPSYQDLSFNWSYLPRPHLIIFFSCTNLLGRDNIFGYEYSTNPNDSGLYNSRPIRQPAPRFVFLGIFITISKDKSMNQLPSL